MNAFRHTLQSEWTKFRSVRSTAWCLVATVGLTVLFAALVAAGSTFEVAPSGKTSMQYVDRFQFAHRSLTGDGSIVAEVTSQRDSHEWAKAGVMIKETATAGAPYAALLLSPEHGVRLQSDFSTDIAGSSAAAPGWLKLVRNGNTVTGYESANGSSWQRVGRVTLDNASATVEIGLFVTSPEKTRVEGTLTEQSERRTPTNGEATFESVAVDGATSTTWNSEDVKPEEGPGAPGRFLEGSTVESAGVFTLTGQGDIGAVPHMGDDGSRVSNALNGVLVGVLPLVALGVLFIASEYRGNLIWSTFAASPARGKVLAAKAVVLGGAAFVVGLIASCSAFLVAQPIMEGNGFRPPHFADPSLADPAVLRAVVGTAGVTALLALLALGIGVILRRTAAAITAMVGLVIIPVLVAPTLPLASGMWVQRLAPVAGLSVQQTKEATEQPWDVLMLPWVGRPWTGFAVLGGYVVTALALGWWLMRRRDA